MSKTQVGIYRLFKLGKMDGNKFDKTVRRLEADLHPVHHSYANQVNENSEKNGLLYVQDEAATDKYWNGEPYNEKAGKAPKAAKATTGDDEKKQLASTASKKEDDDETKGSTAATAGTAKAAKATSGKDPDLDLVGEEKKAKIEELRASYFAVTKEDAMPTWGIKKLKEQIELETAKLK